MLIVTYKPFVLNVIMLSVTYKPFVLNVIMLSVVVSWQVTAKDFIEEWNKTE